MGFWSGPIVVDCLAPEAQAQSGVPVMMDVLSGSQPGTTDTCNHIPAGANVLYMDGHVNFERYPGRYPASVLMCDMMMRGQDGRYLDW